jgi:hypothetical protein
MEDCTYLLVTHSSYEDVLTLYLETNKKHFSNVPITVAIDKESCLDRFKDSISRILVYDDTVPYTQRMIYILSQLSTNYVLVNHDSNVLVGPPNMEVLETLLKSMKTRKIDQMRLSDAGILHHKRNHKIYHKNRGNYFMSILTAIWNRATLLDIYKRFIDHHTKECMECQTVQQFVSTKSNYYISSPNDIYQMPIMHSIPEYFPTVHVTHYGKWTTHAPGNRMYIYQLAKEYSLNLSIRGEF